MNGLIHHFLYSGSVTGLTSGIIAIVCDERPDWNKTKVSFGVCVVMFLAGLAYVTPVRTY